MTLIDIITGLIDFRTFSNIWYWLAVIVTWAVATHWVIGVPFDMVVRARRQGGQAAQDLDIFVAINLRRLLTLSGTPSVILVGIGAFVVTAAAVLGFVYGLELAQGLFCLAFPLVFVAVLTWRSCQRLALDQQTGPAFIRALVLLRFWIQLIAITALFCTALLGIYVMLSQRFG